LITTVSTSENTAVVMAVPAPSVSAAAEKKAGRRRSDRHA
jgi:hypothetical protein